MNETREDELARLIAEQEKDDRDFQPPERGVVPIGLLADFVDVEALGSRPRTKGGAFDSESCPVHGLEYMKLYPSEPYRARCTRCMLDQQAVARTMRDARETAERREERRAYSRETTRKWRERKALIAQ